MPGGCDEKVRVEFAHDRDLHRHRRSRALGSLPPVTRRQRRAGQHPRRLSLDLSALCPDEASWSTGVAAAGRSSRASPPSTRASPIRRPSPATGPLLRPRARRQPAQPLRQPVAEHRHHRPGGDRPPAAGADADRRHHERGHGAARRGAGLVGGPNGGGLCRGSGARALPAAIDSLRRRADRVLDAEAERVLLWPATTSGRPSTSTSCRRRSSASTKRVVSELPLPRSSTSRGTPLP